IYGHYEHQMNELSDIRQQLRLLSSEDQENLLAWLHDCVALEAPRNFVAEAHPAYADRELRLMTVEQYFELEETAALRHEYINGVLYAMAGATVAHNRITFQLATALSSRLGGGACRVFLNDLKLRLELGGDEIFYYPDVMVACDPADWGRNFIRNPRLVAEVLSPSTQHIDCREKALNYHRAGSIEEYLVISQTERRVLVHRRADRWQLDTVCAAEATIELRSLGMSIPVAEIYGDALS
ncbi:MAG TPA: Uma2 family endonuclease, partial [Steroidobacteraceae bacterium]|nr:Uma2 family endonuclease [Steroidobacteraceae bacterium]